MEYRRAKIEGGTYFFTVVTYSRKQILCHPDNVSLLRNSFRYVMARHPFTIDAFVLFPDHFHCILTLPERDHYFSTRLRLTKSYFSHNCDPIFGDIKSLSRTQKKEQTIWQRRFWEHLIRDERDFINHVEYIH